MGKKKSLEKGLRMRKKRYFKVKLDRVGGMFFVVPTIVVDRYGIAIIWLFWALAFLWREER